MYTREDWRIYRGPGFRNVVWFGSSTTPSPSPVSKLVRRHIGRPTKKDKSQTGEGWEEVGRGAESYDGESSINHSVLSDIHRCETVKRKNTTLFCCYCPSPPSEDAYLDEHGRVPACYKERRNNLRGGGRGGGSLSLCQLWGAVGTKKMIEKRVGLFHYIKSHSILKLKLTPVYHHQLLSWWKKRVFMLIYTYFVPFAKVRFCTV